MSLTTTPTPSPAFLDIVWDNKVCIGQCYCDVDGLWKFEGFESHTLVQIAALLDRLNAPYNAELKAYFAALPKEMDATPQDDGMPF